MRMIYTNRDILDSIIEITAQKSKILLTDNDIRYLSLHHPSIEYISNLVDLDPEEIMTIRAEDLNEEIIYLRKAIGNLDKIETPAGVLAQGIRALMEKGYDFNKVNPAFLELSMNRDGFSKGNISKIATKHDLPVESLLEYKSIFERFKELSIIDEIHPTDSVVDIMKWDGIKSLSDLFQVEIVPDKSSKYIDQEFINYLKENEHDLDKMHWRNFERLVAEFFRKVGYHVELGPGTNDGGIDIRVWSDFKSSEGPPLIIIQCKRYSEGNKVSIDTVKAFYADVIHEKTGFGLIATTSSIAIGGKKIINARGYNITTAESTEVKRMIYEMWRESFKH